MMEEVEFFFRNNGTGRPTKKHIINDLNYKSYCGWDGGPFAQSRFLSEYLLDGHEGIPEIDICSTCLKRYRKWHPNNHFTITQ